MSAGTSCGAQHHAQGASAEQFWHAPAGLLPEEGKEEALLMVTPRVLKPRWGHESLKQLLVPCTALTQTCCTC